MKVNRCKTKPVDTKAIDALNFSQEKISGFYLEKYQEARILLIGAGAIGSNAASGMIRKGIGRLDICDDDEVELRNLTRQLFSFKDVGKNKAIQLTAILAQQGLFESIISGYPYRFQELLEADINLSDYDAIICGVDNNPTRVETARFCFKNEIPLIMAGVSRDGNQMYCAVQEPHKACFGCIMPSAINDDGYPCDLPGIIDIIQVVSGFIVYALDTVIMNRYREWNLRALFLNGSVPDSTLAISRKKHCPVCGT